MKTKIFKTLCALIFATSISVAQTTDFNVFLGGTGYAPSSEPNDMSDPSNYYTFSKDGEETTKLWGDNDKIDISGTGAQLQSMQTINWGKWLAYGDINYKNDDGESTLYTSPQKLFLKNSLSVSGQPHAFFKYSGTATVTFGSSDSQDEEFLYYTNSFHNMGHGTVSFVRDANAKQSTFSFRINAEAEFVNGTTIIGDASNKDGYFDSVKMAHTVINNRGNLQIYAKSINFGSYLNSDSTGTLTVYIPDQALKENTPLVEIAGVFQHLDKVVFDFTNYTNIGAGEYTLISAGSLGEGFSDRVYDDIEIRNLTLQDGYTHNLKWVNESNLMLTISVPEPYEAAAVIGIIALALAAYRRRI